MLKHTLKRILPKPVWQMASDRYWWWLNRGRHSWAKLTNSDWRKSQAEILTYKEKYSGKRCFIIGNGPSLKKTNLGLLRDEYTFGLNRVYLMFDQLGFKTTFLVSVNELVLEQCAQDFQDLDMPRFFTWRARRFFQKEPQLMFVDTDFTGPEDFGSDATQRIFEGHTVTFVAMQLAFYMGFDEINLVGVDHNYVSKGEPNTIVESKGDDPNHFSGQYFGEGFRWQLPYLVGSERSYLLARQAFEDAGRRIIDATVGGKLTIFPKQEFDSLFD